MPRSSDHHVVRANRNRNLAVGRHSLLAFAAHDLRLPASAALMAVELADQQMGDGPAALLARGHLALAKQCLREALQLASDLLAMDQATNGLLRFRRASVDVAMLLEDARALTAPLARARHIDVRVRVAHALPPAIGDRGRLLQVLLNLTGNAIKFANRGGRVDLEAWSEGGEMRVSVADNGPGVADEDLAHLFEQYWQGHHIAAYSGAGLGLTIAKCLIEAQGGRIAAGRSRDGGLLVTFAIPIAVQRSAAA